jgi:hypothetical protein
MADQQYVPTLIRLTSEQYEKVRKISFDERIPISEIIRKAVDKSLKKRQMSPNIKNREEFPKKTEVIEL